MFILTLQKKKLTSYFQFIDSKLHGSNKIQLFTSDNKWVFLTW